MAAPNTLHRDSLSDAQRRAAVAGDLDTARTFLIAAMKVADDPATRFTHAALAQAVSAVDDARAGLAAS